MKRLPTLLTLLALSLAPLGAQAVNGAFLLGKLDDAQRLGSDLTAQIKIIQQRVGQAPRTLESRYFRRDSDDSFLIIMTAPDVEKGNGYLRVGDNMWVYRRNTRSFQHINRDENISGTDMKGGDFERRKMSELYKPVVNGGKEAITEEKLGANQVWRLEITAKVDDVTYPKMTVWITKDQFLPLKYQRFSASGVLMQTQLIPAYQPIGGKFIPQKMITKDEFEKGNQSYMEITGVDMRAIDGRMFTKAKLEEFSE